MADVLTFEGAMFLGGTLVAAFVAGLAGFAFGLVAAAVWLHALTPLQTATLVVLYGLIVQGYAVWRLRRRVEAGRLVPLVVGSAIGVPFGVVLLRWASPGDLRVAVGMLLVLFSLYNLVRPKLPGMREAGRLADAGAGLLNGLIGGSTGLAGIVVVVWSGLRGWPRDEQRAAFQPTGVATFLMTILAFGGAGMFEPGTLRLFLVGLPALAVGSALGWMLYGKLDEPAFRRVVLVLLLASGAGLIATGR